ncbi:MAG: glycosyltransferase [Bacteroidota bacterium]
MKKKTIVYLANAANIHTIRWAKYFSTIYEIIIISFEASTIENVRVITFKKNGSSLLNYLAAAPKVRSLIKKINPEFIHAHYAGGYGLLACLSVNIKPFIMSVWGSDIYIAPHKSFVNRYLLKYILAKADLICSTSRAMAKETNKYTTKPILITPFGIDCIEYKPLKNKRNKQEIIIGTIKKLHHLYGIDRLLKAFAILKKTMPESKLKLMIIGDGEQKKILKSLCNSLGIEDSTIFVGEIAQKEVPKYLNEFDLFVALSRSESFGVAVLEASSCELPVVVSDAGGLSEVVLDGKTGFIIPNGDIEVAATKLQILIKDKILTAKIGKNGREFVKKYYSWDQTALIMKSAYQQIITNRSSRLE